MIQEDVKSRIQKLHKRLENAHKRIESLDQKRASTHVINYLEILGSYIEQDKNIFGQEEWHPLFKEKTDFLPSEYLLRLQSEEGENIAPYTPISTLYESGYSAEIDAIIFLTAIHVFQQSSDKQISINISARSLQSKDFSSIILQQAQAIGINTRSPQSIILEVHESHAKLLEAQKIKCFREAGIKFAIDDVGLSISDVFKLADFDGIADIIKIDRKAVLAKSESTHSLDHVMSFVRSLLSNTQIVVEGVKTVEHAMQIHKVFPDVEYAQGMGLPFREMFAKRWQTLLSA